MIVDMLYHLNCVVRIKNSAVKIYNMEVFIVVFMVILLSVVAFFVLSAVVVMQMDNVKRKSKILQVKFLKSTISIKGKLNWKYKQTIIKVKSDQFYNKL